MGIKPQAFESLLKANDIKTGVLENIAKAINKSVYFFFSTTPETKNAIAKEVDVLKGIPLITIEAMAGFSKGDFQIMNNECKHYVIPVFRNAQFLIRIAGSSMIPKYSSGDIVACKKLSLNDIFFQWNKVYVLDTDQGALIKRIKPGSDKQHIKCVSENSNYDPFELSLTQIHSLALVIGVVRLE